MVIAGLVLALLCAGISAAAIRSGPEVPAGDARAASLVGADALEGTAASTTPATPASTAAVTSAPATSTSVLARTSSTVARTTSTKAASPSSATTSTTKAPSNGASQEQPTGSYGPRDPNNSVTVPYQPGQTSWSATMNGLVLRVTMSPASPRAGEAIHFVLQASAPTPTCCQIHIWYGDGFGWPSGLAMTECDAYALTKQTEVVHTYNAHGRREFMFDAFANGCAGDGPVATLYGSFDVAPGVSSGQGPSLPTVNFDTTVPLLGHETDPTYITVAGMAVDADGFITKLLLDWGDGSAVQTLAGAGTCWPSIGGWPLQSMVLVASSPPVWHHFTGPGDYRITLTAVSTACDGSDEQRGVGVINRTIYG